MAIIVQKFGGATLSDPIKIKALAEKVQNLRQKGHQVVLVVSAMGQTTNSLLELAAQITSHPSRRELDMLLTTGERISMALMSMALNEIGCPAISFTGSQAGVLTDDSHLGALIIDVKAQRVLQALDSGQVVVLAGFQGVCAATKEITTLGRGGTDTTAVAMAAFLKADHCEILKEVPAVFSADPRIVAEAHPISKLTYEELMDMTFWGAKVLHFRSVELAHTLNVPLYVGPAHDHIIQMKTQKPHEGTFVVKEHSMFEAPRILSLNSHAEVLKIEIPNPAMEAAFKQFHQTLDAHEIASPQILDITIHSTQTTFWVTGPSEMLAAIKNIVPHEVWSTVTATCIGAVSAPLAQNILDQLKKHHVIVPQLRLGSKSLSLFLRPQDRVSALQALHDLI